MDDKIKINLNMAGFSLSTTINRKEEEIVREAAKQVNKYLTEYRERYRSVPQEKVLVMIAYQLALKNLQLEQRNETSSYIDKIEQLTDELEKHFKEWKEEL